MESKREDKRNGNEVCFAIDGMESKRGLVASPAPQPQHHNQFNSINSFTKLNEIDWVDWCGLLVGCCALHWLIGFHSLRRSFLPLIKEVKVLELSCSFCFLLCAEQWRVAPPLTPQREKKATQSIPQLSAGTAANQSNQSNKNKIILFFFVDDWLLDCSLGAAKKSKDNLIELPILKEQFKLNLSFYFSCSHQSVHLPQIQIKLTHCFVFVYNSWLAAYTVIIYF